MRRLFLVVAAVALLDMLLHTAIAPLLPHLSDDFDLSRSSAGLLGGAYAAGTLAGTLPGAWLATRIEARRTVLLGLGLLAAASLAFAFAGGLGALAGARFAQGFAAACSWIGALTWLVQCAPRERRGELIGGVLAAAVAGELLGPVVGAAGALTSSRLAFSAVAVLALLLLLAALAAPGVAPGARRPPVTLRRVARERTLVAGWWLITLPALFAGVLTLLGSLRLGELGTSGAVIGAVWLSAAAVEAVLSPLVGRLSDRRGRMLPIRAGLACAVPAALVLPLPGDATLAALAIVASVVVLAGVWGPAIALLSDAAEEVGADQAWAFALVNAGWAAGQAAGAAGGGALADAAGDTVPYVALSALCLLTVAATLVRRSPVPTGDTRAQAVI